MGPLESLGAKAFFGLSSRSNGRISRVEETSEMRDEQSMNTKEISRETAVEIARKYAGKHGFDTFTIEDAFLENGIWKIVLDFDDAPIGLPGFLIVEVDGMSGEPNHTRGL